MMHLKLSITCPANAACWVASSSGWMRIEIQLNMAIVKYDTSLRVISSSKFPVISSLAIERFGVIDCTRTFFCSRQVHKRTIGACNTSISVNESCEKRRYYAKPIKHTNWINKKYIINITSRLEKLCKILYTFVNTRSVDPLAIAITPL